MSKKQKQKPLVTPVKVMELLQEYGENIPNLGIDFARDFVSRYQDDFEKVAKLAAEKLADSLILDEVSILLQEYEERGEITYDPNGNTIWLVERT